MGSSPTSSNAYGAARGSELGAELRYQTWFSSTQGAPAVQAEFALCCTWLDMWGWHGVVMFTLLVWGIGEKREQSSLISHVTCVFNRNLTSSCTLLSQHHVSHVYILFHAKCSEIRTGLYILMETCLNETKKLLSTLAGKSLYCRQYGFQTFGCA